MSMEARLSLVMLGVADPARSKAFYEALGFKAAFEADEIVFIPLNGMVLGLFRKANLDADMQRANTGPGAIALAYNTRSEAEVEPLLSQAVAAGATLLKPAQKAEWGGYSGYFADPDGHAWEIAFNPYWVIGENGDIRMEAS